MLQSAIPVLPSRVPGQNRAQSGTTKTPTAQGKSYLPPIGGVISNAPLSSSLQQSALVLENFWITRRGVRPRGGTNHRVTIAGRAEYLFGYHAGGTNEYFVADDNNLYEFSDSTADGTTLSASLTGQTNADYTHLESQNDAGSFIHLVNGTDSLQLYDGTSWQEVTGVSTPHAITGVTTSNLSHVFSHNERIWFIESGSMKAWYLATNAVSGAATKLSLAGVFKKGGSLLFGATWSSDSGAGMDDRCVFGTDQGEVAVYSGTDPSSASTWSLQGVYDVGDVFDKNAHVNIGGDLVIGTKGGLIPMSGVVSKDSTQLKVTSLLQNISPDFDRQVVLAANSTDWHFVKWDQEGALMVCPPVAPGVENVCFAASVEAGGYSTFTGWVIESMAVLGGNLHYGDTAGKVYQCEQGGLDDTSSFECRGCLSFDDMGSAGAIKTGHMVRGVWEYRVPINPKHSMATNYQPNFPVAPEVETRTTSIEGTWDVSDWDQAEWASSNPIGQFVDDWEGVSVHGEALAPQFQLVSGQSYVLDCELVRIDVTYSVGSPL